MSVEDAVMSEGPALAVQEPLVEEAAGLVNDGNQDQVHLNGDSEPKLEDAAVREDREPYDPDQLRYTPVFSLLGHSRSVSALAFSPDGFLLASASADRTVRIWSLRTGSLVTILKGHQGGVNDIVWSPCGKYIVSGSDDKTIGVWNAKSGYDVRQLMGHTSYVFCVAFSPTSTLVASGSFDESVRIWDVRRGICHRTISAHSEAVTDVDFNRDGSLIASCSYDGAIRLWDVPTGLCLATLPQPTSSPTTSIRFTPSSSHLLASSLDSTLRLWDLANGKIVKTYRSTPQSAQEQRAALESGTGSKMFSNEKFAIKSHFLIRPAKQVNDGDVTGQEQQQRKAKEQVYIVAGSEDCKVYFWNVQTRKIPEVGGVLTGHRDVIGAVAVHPTKAILATASMEHDLSIKVYLDPTVP